MFTAEIAMDLFFGKFFINILDAAFYFLVAIILFNLKPKIKQLILPSVIQGFIFALCFVLPLLYNFSLFITLIYIFGPLLSLILFMRYTLKIDIRKSLVATFIAFLIQTLTAIPLSFIMELFNIDVNQMYFNPYFMFLINLINLILDLPFLLIVNRLKNVRIKKRNFVLISLIILINFAIIVLNTVFIDIYLFKYDLERDFTLYFISLGLFCLSAITTIFVSSKISKLSAKELEL